MTNNPGDYSKKQETLMTTVKSSKQFMLAIAPFTNRTAIQDISRKTNVHQATMRKWRNGETEASFNKAVEVINAAGYDIQITKRK